MTVPEHLYINKGFPPEDLVIQTITAHWEEFRRYERDRAERYSEKFDKKIWDKTLSSLPKHIKIMGKHKINENHYTLFYVFPGPPFTQFNALFHKIHITKIDSNIWISHPDVETLKIYIPIFKKQT